MVIQYVGSASITYVEWKFQQWPVQIITYMEYRVKIFGTAGAISPVPVGLRVRD